MRFKLKEILKKSYFGLCNYLSGFYIKRNCKQLRNRNKNCDKIRVMFLLQFPEMWNSEKPLYDLLNCDSNFEVSVLAIPRIKEEKRFDNIYEINNKAYEYCIKNRIKVINSRNNGHWYQIKSRDVDYIFIQRPYSFQLPRCYSFRKLSKVGLVCHIPYGFSISKDTHLKFNFNNTFMCYVYAFFADSEVTYNYYTSLESKNRFTHGYNLGFPRFELINLYGGEKSKVKTFLWTPRWSVGQNNGDSHFLDYLEMLLLYFENRKDVSLIIRPHPLMFPFFLEKGLIDHTYIKKLNERVEKIENVCFDYNEDYLISFSESDILISDFSTLIVEFFVTGKPIIYCGEFDDFNYIAQKIATSFYSVKSKDELQEIIETLVANNDFKQSNRKELLDKLFNLEESASENIKNVLLKIAGGEE